MYGSPPRGGGEDRLPRTRRTAATDHLCGGSPSRGRRGRAALGTLVRTTSASAERTRSPRGLPRCPANHLRAGGEHSWWWTNVVKRYESPPRRRRARYAECAGAGTGRITSAWAESTGTPPGSRGPRSDHLRAGGERIWPVGLLTDCLGPPPRVRRAPRRLAEPPRGCRTTSARAESTPERAEHLMTVTDHLRACGEHDSTTGRTSRDVGPPPRVRRAPDALYGRPRHVRTTSARAESTLSDLRLTDRIANP